MANSITRYRNVGLMVAIVAPVLSGCGAGPYEQSYRELTDHSRVLHVPPRGTATIIVRRDRSGLGDKYYTMDNDRIVKIEKNEQYTFTVPPGQYVVGAECIMLGDTFINQLNLNAVSGKSYYYVLISKYAERGDPCIVSPMSR